MAGSPQQSGAPGAAELAAHARPSATGLDCDEAQSGAVLEAAAGRTQRKTGIACATCRP